MKTNKIVVIAICFLCLILIANTAAADRVISWNGKQWNVRSGDGNPGGNKWSDANSNVWVSGGKLHLTIQKVDGVWYSTEVSTVSSDYSYGVYKWKVDSPIMNLDPNVVSALFFYHDDKHEIDFEAAKWGNEKGNSLDLSVQPTANSMMSYDDPKRNVGDVTYIFDWEPTYVHFTAYDSSGTKIADWTCKDQSIIPHVTGQVYMQQWLDDHKPPINGQSTTMVISSFSYTPSEIK